MPTVSILDELDWRGLYADCTDRPALSARLAERPITLYCGFDPTADSLHVGNLVPLLALRRFQILGHHPIALAGGATGMIGDPSGKSDERNLLTPDQLTHNLERIKPQLAKFLDFEARTHPARLVNNYDWTQPLSILDFLRDIGKHITVNGMVAKDSVRSRMEDRSAGISFAEFSYMLLQGFDFCHLKKMFDCDLQIGATDQWGNIVVGAELTRKKLGATVWGLVLPLLTKADGSKYGKTATGTVWLDPQRTSPYRFYQFFVNSEDTAVGALLKSLTFLPHSDIASLEQATAAEPESRAAQKALAREMTVLVHGKDAFDGAVRASEILFGGPLDGVTDTTFHDVVGEVPTTTIAAAQLAGTGLPVANALVAAGLSASKSQARRDIEAGGVYLNNVRITEVSRTAATNDLLFGQFLLLRKGRRSYAVIRVE